jgi:hypothetical protein
MQTTSSSQNGVEQQPLNKRDLANISSTKHHSNQKDHKFEYYNANFKVTPFQGAWRQF